LRQIGALYGVGTFGGLGDGQLLERFANREGEAAELAFATLVERHGPMVFRVCRGVLNDLHAAEDAFQATFLILVRKAGSIRSGDSVASWLHGVATRVSLDARASSRRRQRHEGQYDGRRPIEAVGGDLDRRDLEAILGEELQRLPERYRAPVVLCYFEGLSHEEAALRLGRPVQTIRTRLARARERLRGRLARRGLAPLAGAVALSADASASVPRTLADSTVKAAMRVAAGRAVAAGAVPATVAALTEGVLRTMLMTKLKFAAAVLVTLATAVTGAGVFAFQDAPREEARPSSSASANNAPLALQDPSTAEAKLPDLPGSAPRPETTPNKFRGRGAALGEYLEKTEREVNSAVAELRSEVAELRARLQEAEANLRKMEALQAALSDKRTQNFLFRTQGGTQGNPFGNANPNQLQTPLAPPVVDPADRRKLLDLQIKQLLDERERLGQGASQQGTPPQRK
jgi:RNA polymerase sigma factor (sigma-70 family)